MVWISVRCRAEQTLYKLLTGRLGRCWPVSTVVRWTYTLAEWLSRVAAAGFVTNQRVFIWQVVGLCVFALRSELVVSSVCFTRAPDEKKHPLFISQIFLLKMYEKVSLYLFEDKRERKISCSLIWSPDAPSSWLWVWLKPETPPGSLTWAARTPVPATVCCLRVCWVRSWDGPDPRDSGVGCQHLEQVAHHWVPWCLPFSASWVPVCQERDWVLRIQCWRNQSSHQ